AFFAAQRELRAAGRVLAYHDRSDGGLLVTLAEMAFAAHAGLEVHLPEDVADPVAYLFNEELGAVLQVARDELPAVERTLTEHGVAHRVIATPTEGRDVVIEQGGRELYRAPRVELQRTWSELSYRMQALRDDPDCAREAFESALDEDDPGLGALVTFDVDATAAPRERRAARPRVAVLREQGVNGHREMAAALDRAGF